MSIFTDFVLVRSRCLLGRSRPSIHRWKARVVKEKKKERKEGGREGVWVVFRHQKHGVQNWCRTNHGIDRIPDARAPGAEPTREKDHIGEDPASKASPSTENGPPPDRPKSDLFSARTGRSACMPAGVLGSAKAQPLKYESD